MPLQTGQNVTVVRKRQSALGTPASGSGGFIYRINEGSAGLNLDKAIIPNPEARRDGQKTRGRHGTKKANGSYEECLSVGTQTDLMEAILRSTATAQVDITQTQMTSITTTTTTIVAAGGDWRTALTTGVHKGDLVKLTNHSTSANNGKWFRVVSVTATVITLGNYNGAVPLITDAVPDATFTLAVAKFVVSGATPTEYYYSIDEYDGDVGVDVSSFGTDLKLCRIEINAQPDQMIKVTSTWMGLDYTPTVSGSSPVLTGTATTTLGLVMADGVLRIGGVDYSLLTGFSITIDLGGTVPSVLAPNAPDVFLDNMQVSGSFTALKQDLTFLTAFRNETQVEFFILCAELEAAPYDFVSIYVGNATLSGASGPMGSTGPRSITVPWNAGKDEAGGDAAATTVKFSTSV